MKIGVDTGAGGIPVADLHPAVDLRNRKAPLAQFAQWPAVAAVAHQEIQRVLVFGEEEQFLAAIRKEALFLKHALQLGELGFHLPAFQFAGLIDEARQRRDLRAQRGRIDRRHHVFQLGDDLLLLLLGEVLKIVR